MQTIYCGPTLPHGALLAYSVFIGPLPATVEKVIDECPEVGRLIVPVEKLGEVRRRCEISGTEKNRLYKEIKSHKWEANK